MENVTVLAALNRSPQVTGRLSGYTRRKLWDQSYQAWAHWGYMATGVPLAIGEYRRGRSSRRCFQLGARPLAMGTPNAFHD